MIVLALYDIHGNREALEAVLADPRSHAAQAVVIGGDVVYGPFVLDVLARIAKIDVPVHWIRGNCEREVANADMLPDDPVGAASRRAATEIGEERLAALARLPMTVQLDGVLYCHATPGCDDEILTRASPDERYADVLDAVTAQLVVGGHTHQQHDRQLQTGRFVNAGSVGLPYEGDGAARWLLTTDGNPHLLSTVYDAVEAGKGMLATGWPDVESVTASLIDPVAPQEVTDAFEAAAA